MSRALAGDAEPVHEIARDTWCWVADVPWLPDVAGDADRVDAAALLGGYHALAETLAMERPGLAALQIRFSVRPALDDRVGVVDTRLVLRARSRAGVIRLAALVRACLSAELPLRPIADPDAARDVIAGEAPTVGWLQHVVEVRRRIEDLAAEPDLIGDVEPVEAGVLGWEPGPSGLRHAIGVLARHRSPATVLLHLEPARPSAALLAHLQDVVRAASAESDAAGNALRVQVARQYRQRLRDLPRAAVSMRVQLHADAGIAPGLAESVAVALTADDSFALVRAETELEVALATELRTQLRSRPWRSPLSPEIEELQFLCSPTEAARVVRIPVFVRGGAAGVPSRPVSVLPRSAQPVTGERGRIRVGAALGGGDTAIGVRDLNQHLLVAGLPGFGKTITTQSILVRLWENESVPFLVLDPAKSDYAALQRALGPALRHVALTPSEVAFNPFSVPPGVNRHTHAGRVLAAFDATFRLSEVWPAGYVTLGRAMFDAYEEAAGGSPDLRQLASGLEAVVRRSGFTGSAASDIRAALLGRIEFLSSGPLGRAFGGGDDAAIDWAALLSAPTVIEMREFGGPTERSLVFAMLLAGLISYREANPVGPGLGHVTVIEEAHRLLAASAGAASEGIRLFVEAIAELRASGEGFVIVDQAPTQLDSGVVKLCGSVIAHRMVDRDERERIGAATLLDERQQEDLARLRHGQAVVYTASSDAGVTTDVLAHPALLDDALPTARGRLPWLPVETVTHEASVTELVRQAKAQGLKPSAAQLQVAAQLVRRHDGDAHAILHGLDRLGDVLRQEGAR